jgi:hypothetical protein
MGLPWPHRLALAGGREAAAGTTGPAARRRAFRVGRGIFSHSVSTWDPENPAPPLLPPPPTRSGPVSRPRGARAPRSTTGALGDALLNRSHRGAAPERRPGGCAAPERRARGALPPLLRPAAGARAGGAAAHTASAPDLPRQRRAPRRMAAAPPPGAPPSARALPPAELAAKVQEYEAFANDVLKRRLAGIGERRARYEAEREELAELQRGVRALREVRAAAAGGGGLEGGVRWEWGGRAAEQQSSGASKGVYAGADMGPADALTPPLPRHPEGGRTRAQDARGRGLRRVLPGTRARHVARLRGRRPGLPRRVHLGGG